MIGEIKHDTIDELIAELMCELIGKLVDELFSKHNGWYYCMVVWLMN